MMILFVCIDDTDTVDSKYGTGRQGRRLMTRIDDVFDNLVPSGVVRQQLLVDPRVPYTTHNSCACLRFEIDGTVPTDAAIEQIAGAFLRAESAAGSDPGLCIANSERVTDAVVEFGRRAAEDLLTEETAYDLADDAGIYFEEYGGTGEGVIGALAGVGRTTTGDLGRFIEYGSIREYEGPVDVATLRADGIRVTTNDGQRLTDGTIDSRRWVRPELRDGRPVLVVTRRDENWVSRNALDR